jgi:hypothetical protein
MPEDEPTPEELLDIEAADAYLDALGNKRDFEGDQLGATQWRKDVDAEPLDMTGLPSAHTTRGELPPATGGTVMSQLSDLAAQVAAQSDVSEILGALQHVENLLSEKNDALMSLLADTAHVDSVSRAHGAAFEAIFNSHGPIANFSSAISQAAGAIRGGS